jgi:hypothetical protein
MPLKVRTIDIFVSSPEDVQKERSLVERVIRSVAAESGVPVTVNYSNWLRKLNVSDKIPAQIGTVTDEGRTWLRPCFWEYQGSRADHEYQERIPNTGSYDLVICILWSQLGAKLSPAFIMPDGATPKHATEYEIAWVLDQINRTPGFPELRVYRNRSTPHAPVQPRSQRETFFRDWDAVQDFFANWEKKPEFAKACNDYLDLQQFETLFREHFCDFLKRQVDKEIVPRRTSTKGRSWNSDPFRGLRYFDFEHGPIFHGRTKAVGEVVDSLNEQAKAKKPFVLVLGPSGSGKTSLVRAGVLPLLTELATVMGEGPWRRAVTRPGSGGDPFGALAAALVADGALPELQEQKSREALRKISADLTENPGSVAVRIGELLDQISVQELDQLLDREKNLSPLPGRIETAELARHRKLRRTKPKAQLAIFIDQLEDLFASGYAPNIQQAYIGAVAALVRSQRVHVIAALRSEFYGSYQQFPGLVELTNPHGRLDLQPPSPEEIARMVRSPAEAAGIRFDRDAKTGKHLDEALIEATIASSDSLPLLEHLLSQLHQKQAARKDGLLRWSDYRDLGEFDGALSEHAERTFNALSIDAQQAFEFVMRRLVFLEPDGKPGCRPARYQELVSSHELDSRMKTATQSFISEMVAEGLFNAEPDHRQDLVVQVAHPALLRNWPRFREWLIGEQEFIRMRDRVDGCLKLWLKGGRQTHDLLTPGLGLADGETLLNHFHSSLSDSQVKYIQKSLAGYRKSRLTTYVVLVSVLIGLVALATIAAVKRLSIEGRQTIMLEYSKLERKIAELAQTGHLGNLVQSGRLPDKTSSASQADEKNQSSTLETQLRQTLEDLQQNQQQANATSAARSALEVQLQEALAKLEQDTQAEVLAVKQRSALESQLKETQDKLDKAQKAASAAAAVSADLQNQLKQSEANSEQSRRAATSAADQQSFLQGQVKELSDKLKQSQETLENVQRVADQATTENSAIGTELKQNQEKLEQAQKAASVAAAQATDLQTQLKQAQEKVQQNQELADAASNQRSAVETELKEVTNRLQKAEENASKATAQAAALQSQLQKAETDAQTAQHQTELSAQGLAAAEARLKDAEKKAQLGQKIADLIAAQARAAGSGDTTEDSRKQSQGPTEEARSGRALPLDSGQNTGSETQQSPSPAQPPNQ